MFREKVYGHPEVPLRFFRMGKTRVFDNGLASFSFGGKHMQGMSVVLNGTELAHLTGKSHTRARTRTHARARTLIHTHTRAHTYTHGR